MPGQPEQGFFMRIDGALSIPGGLGRTDQIVVHFFYDSGFGTPAGPVVSNNVQFADTGGFAACGTQLYPVPPEGLQATWICFIPYAVLEVPVGQWGPGPQGLVYQPRPSALLAQATLFVDGFGVSLSPSFPSRYRGRRGASTSVPVRPAEAPGPDLACGLTDVTSPAVNVSDLIADLDLGQAAGERLGQIILESDDELSAPVDNPIGRRGSPPRDLRRRSRRIGTGRNNPGAAPVDESVKVPVEERKPGLRRNSPPRRTAAQREQPRPSDRCRRSRRPYRPRPCLLKKRTLRERRVE